MKTWALGAGTVAIFALAMAACGNGGGNTGGGGSGTTSTHVTSTHSTTAVTSSSGSDPCADGSDCSQCADFSTCATCEENNHPQGAQVFNDLLDCIYCQACYTVCDGASAGCQAAPTTMDSCDKTTPDPNGPGCADNTTNPPAGCIPCSESGTCKPKLDACKASSDCIAFNTAIQACPSN